MLGDFISYSFSIREGISFHLIYPCLYLFIKSVGCCILLPRDSLYPLNPAPIFCSYLQKVQNLEKDYTLEKVYKSLHKKRLYVHLYNVYTLNTYMNVIPTVLTLTVKLYFEYMCSPNIPNISGNTNVFLRNCEK